MDWLVVDDLGAMMKRRFGSRIALATAIAIGVGSQAACAQMPSNSNAGTTTSGVPASGEPDSTRHVWYDGDRRRVLHIDPEWVADFRGTKPNLERAPVQPATATTEKSGPVLAPGQSQVLRDETGAPRALPGGVIVRLRDADVADARKVFAELELTPVRALDPEERTWLLESPAGLESLALANRLHETGRFETATPNWWRPRALK